MWMKHPQESDTNLRPVKVEDLEQEKDYLARGYVTPNCDATFFDEMQVKIELANQLISLLMTSKSQNEATAHILADHGQLYCLIDSIRTDMEESHRAFTEEIREELSTMRVAMPTLVSTTGWQPVPEPAPHVERVMTEKQYEADRAPKKWWQLWK